MSIATTLVPRKEMGAQVTERSAAVLETATALLEAVYRREFGRLAALGTLLAGDRAAGEDLAQEVFLRALRRERVEPGHLREPAWPWLRLALVRLAATRRARIGAELKRLAHLYERPKEDWPDESGDCLRALAGLPPRMRACAVLFYQEDLSTAEVARLLGCAEKTVENQLSRARTRLARELGEEVA